MNFIEKILSGAVGRWIRVAAATAVSSVIAKHQNNEWYIALTPFISMVGKKLRDKYPGLWEWLPF